MHSERQVSLFRNGRNQAIRIPREFELEGNKALIHMVDNVSILALLKPIIKWSGSIPLSLG